MVRPQRGRLRQQWLEHGHDPLYDIEERAMRTVPGGYVPVEDVIYLLDRFDPLDGDRWKRGRAWAEIKSSPPIPTERLNALCRMLVDSGDMTPLAVHILRKLWDDPSSGANG